MKGLKPLVSHFGPLGKPEEGGTDRSAASTRADALKRMAESDGWKVVLELIEMRQRHEQKTLMVSGTKEPEQYERLVGQWAGMDRVLALVEGGIRYGEQAAREMEDPGQEAAA